MKNKRTFTRAALLALFAGSTLLTAWGAQSAAAAPVTHANFSFQDVSHQDWAIRYITEMSAKGVISGDGYGHFRPQATVSHEEAIVMTIRAMGLTQEALSVSSSASLAVTDSQNVSTWAKPYVEVALQHGLIDSNTALSPAQPADREWVTELVVRALGLRAEAQAHMQDSLSFQDASAIDNAAVGYVAVATAEGILHGYPNQTFQPHKPVSREEMATLLCQADAQFEQSDSGSISSASDLHGTIESLNPNGLTLRTSAQQTQSVTFASPCYFFLNEQWATLGSLQSGMQAHVLLNPQGQAVFVQATPVATTTPAPNPNPNPPTWAMQSDGLVTAYTAPTGTTAGSITITPFVQSQVISTDPEAVKQSYTASIAPNATVSENGVAKSFADVQPGDRVRLEIVANTVQAIELVQAAYPRGPIQPQ